MSQETGIALLGFAFVMSVSPGPGNFLLLASGVNFGFRRSLPLVFGISFGFLAMVFSVGIGLGEILKQAPVIYTFLKFLCAAYVLWLAFKIARSRSMGNDSQEQLAKPITFFQAAAFQLVNPKAWAVALIVTVSYTTPENYLSSLILVILLFALINLPSISLWAASGVALRHILDSSRKISAFNIVMAALLIISMTPAILGAIE